MNYHIQFDSSPVYELNFSFGIFKRPLGMKFLKALDIGGQWNQTVRETVGDKFTAKVEQAGDLSFLNLLDVLICDSTRNENVEGFLQWLDQLSVGGIYEILAPHISNYQTLPIQLDEERKKSVELLSEWNEKYFSNLTALPKRFKEEVAEKRVLLNNTANEDILLKLTEGITIDSTEGLEKIVLTPTTHYRPLSAVYINKNFYIIRYPYFQKEDALKLERSRITNMGRALSDENRLEMLKILSTEKYNLTELALRLGTTKANVHHHLVFLRIAGLLNIHVMGEGKSLYYSLKSSFTEDLKSKLDHLFLS